MMALADKHKWVPTQPLPPELEDSKIKFDFVGDGHRHLYDTIKDPNLKSNLCKLDCIDEGLNFCASSDFSQGYCCKEEEVCPRASFCSYDNPKAPLFFKYLVCPNEVACESKIITPEVDGTILKRAVDKYEHKFVQGDVCSYIVKAPEGMGEYDKLMIKIYNIENADVYLAKGKGYLWLNHLDQLVNDGDEFDTKDGW